MITYQTEGVEMPHIKKKRDYRMGESRRPNVWEEGGRNSLHLLLR